MKILLVFAKKYFSNLLKRKTRRPMIIQDVDSDNDNLPREAELEFENLNLNFDKYCFLCHKEITFSSEDHAFFRCKTCSKYFHRDCYKEYNLKQTEKGNLLIPKSRSQMDKISFLLYN